MFIENEAVTQAVLYNFAVIGEAASKVPNEVQRLYPDIPWPLIVGMRNVVIHEYFRVDYAILFKTLREDLPLLLTRLNSVASKRP